ncbi:RRQRL motif-containing zinc-binding protein [Streptomyces paradoxus]|uniref:RRQRL motif-containing zinc-binding protein n=1 Tax=Streptomyces paradoxus TaxID=66375 RepID=UPI0024839867|nr:RRQRL motif-containing zinc-binding protein [Streptomyces paradoxus]
MTRPRKRRRREVKRVPRSAGTLPEYDRNAAPEGLVTRRQLRALNLSPGGHGPVAVLRCTACSYRPDQACIHPTRAWLYSVELARPKRTPTLAQEEALDRAMAARSTCPQCRRRYYSCLQAAAARSRSAGPRTARPAPETLAARPDGQHNTMAVPRAGARPRSRSHLPLLEAPSTRHRTPRQP